MFVFPTFAFGVVASPTVPLETFDTATLTDGGNLSSNSNPFTFTVQPSAAISAGSSITLSGLTGSATVDGSVTLSGGGAAIFGSAGTWTQSTGTLVLTVDSGQTLPTGSDTVVTFTLTNPASGSGVTSVNLSSTGFTTASISGLFLEAQANQYNIPNSTDQQTEATILALSPTNSSGEVTVKFGSDTYDLYVWDGSAWYIYNNDTSLLINQYSVSFDGTDDYINIPHDSAFNITGSITISAWFKLDSNTKYMSFLTKRASGSINFQFYNTLTGGGFDGNLRFAPGDGSAYAGSSQIPTGSWNHGAIVVDSGTYTFYLNGDADGTGSLTLNTTNSADLTIGRLGDTANYGDGKVDEVAIFNTALSASDVAALRDTSGSNPVPANISSLNPVGWWRMGDGSDGSGNNDGTVVGGLPQIYNVATDGSGNRITGIDGAMTNIASPNGIVTDVPS